MNNTRKFLNSLIFTNAFANKALEYYTEWAKAHRK
jgi:hypothetical protein